MDIAIMMAFAIYFCIVFTIGYFAYLQSKNAAGYNLGGRSLGPWVTAIAAHASDMSSWLFMGFPAAIYATGTLEIWTAISLTFFMYLNWKIIAPRIRILTEQYNAMTLSSFFEKHFADTKGLLRITSSSLCLFFFTVYISANLIAMGRLFEAALGLPYALSIMIGVVAIFFVLLGGFSSVSWIDFFQGIFLLGVIIFVPLYALWLLSASANPLGIVESIRTYAATNHLSLSLFPRWNKHDMFALLNAIIWGLGYFGQPHIITKFMGIRDVNDVKEAQYIGISWQIITLSAAVLVGFVGMLYFPAGMANNEYIFIDLVREILPSFVVGFVLCAIMASTLNVMGAQVLASVSTLSEDLLKPYCKGLQDKAVLYISRLSVVVICLISMLIAYHNKNTNTFSLIKYAWTGLGCTFGPLMLASVSGWRATTQGAFYCILTGGLCAALWPILDIPIPAMIPGFLGGFIALVWVRFDLTNKI